MIKSFWKSIQDLKKILCKLKEVRQVLQILIQFVFSSYGWVKEGTKGAQGMPLNVQIIGRPWNEELVLRAMIELQGKVKY